MAGHARLLTPAGAAGIAVVELGGSGTEPFLDRHVTGRRSAKRATHVRLCDGEDVLDDPLLVPTPAGWELHLHGGPWIVRRTLELAGAAGLTISRSDTIDKPALADTSWLGETSAEVEAAVERLLPLATTEAGVRLLLDQPRRRTAGASLPMTTLHRMLWPARVALVGPADVGKSTLANRLLGRDRFNVAAGPGTTRDWGEELADLRGVPVLLTDTPGRRQTIDAIEAEAIALSLPVSAAAAVVVALNTEPDWPASDVQVLSKADQHDETAGLRVSAVSGEGLGELVDTVLHRLGVDVSSLDRTRASDQPMSR